MSLSRTLAYAASGALFAGSASAQCTPGSFFGAAESVPSCADGAFGLDTTSVTGANLLAVACPIEQRILLQIRQNGTYVFFDSLPTPGGPIDVIFEDVNGDSFPDIITANATSSAVGVRLNTGTTGTSFLPEVEHAAGTSTTRVYAGDVNGDTVTDLVATNFDSSHLSVFHGNGDGTFASESQVALPNPAIAAAIADLDGDGENDLVAVYDSASAFGIAVNQGGGVFAALTSQATLAGTRDAVALDASNDGIPDLALLTDAGVALHLGNGDGSVQAAQPVSDPAPNGLSVADIDADGRTDLVVAFDGPGGGISVLLGQGDGSFLPGGSYPIGVVLNQRIAASDIDGDADIDLLVPGGSFLSVLLNRCNTAPEIVIQPPDRIHACAGITFSISVSQVTGSSPLFYQWQTGTDDLADDGRLTGTNTDTLTISNARPSDADAYRVVVSNAFGEAVSAFAVVTVQGGTCAGDADNSGAVDFNDLVETLFLFGPCPD